MQWKTRPLGYFSYTVLCCLCKRGDGRAAREGGEHHLFQFTPLREGRPRCGVVCCQILQISIHAPARGATSTGPGKIVDKIHFNSRPCERGDVSPQGNAGAYSLFQFTPLREGRRYQRCSQSDPSSHFNSRPCERGDLARSGVATGHRGISIHAPARGATHGFILGVATVRFQFTPLREGRQFASTGSAGKKNFNSRPCERGDVGAVPSLDTIRISIHAPARGATHNTNKKSSSYEFQFTPLREGRLRSFPLPSV